MAKLTGKQKKFIEEYLIDFNATRSAIAAGYSEKTAAATGNENLRKPLIQQAIQAEANRHTSKVDVTVENILTSILEIRENGMIKGEDGEMLDKNASLKANDMLGKYMKMFTDKEINVKIEMPDIKIGK